tara:strand:- start:184 stop:345 length:162 start_codon:yes stop_codon:yes gene_type:complete
LLLRPEVAEAVFPVTKQAEMVALEVEEGAALMEPEVLVQVARVMTVVMLLAIQ